MRLSAFDVMKGWSMARRFAPVLLLVLAGAVSCICLNRPRESAVQKRLTESCWVSNNGATISFSPSGEAHIMNSSQEIDIAGTYQVYILRNFPKNKVIVDVSIRSDERYAEYVLDGNILISENGFCYYVVG